MRVLIVEDDKNIINLLEVTLELRPDLTADYCPNGKEALKAISSHDYGMALIDGQLPDMQGADIAKELRKKQPNVIILLMSADMDQFETLLTYKAQIKGFPKPFDPMHLLEKIDKILAKDKES